VNLDDIKAQLADHYFEQQNFAQARELIDEIRTETTKNSRANLVHAKFLLKNNKPKKALTILDSLIRNNFSLLDRTMSLPCRT
jgi:thioredoxin-like negative regulator of GroEL